MNSPMNSPMNGTLKRSLNSLIWVGIGVLAGLLFFVTWPHVNAYPEYADRTGEQCTACHINPAGGGPRTLRGLLWIADGRQDQVPQLPTAAGAGGDNALDGATLFADFECYRCHGVVGEGGIAPTLIGTPWTVEQLTDLLRNGIGAMKGYAPERMADAQMQALIPYVQAIGRGEIEAGIILQQRPLDPIRRACDSGLRPSTRTDCGGN